MAFKKRRLKTLLNESHEEINKLIEDNIKLVYKFVADFQKTHNSRLTRDELISAGYVGLIKAAEHYKETKGIEFSTYCAFWIQDAFRNELASRNTIYLPLTLLRHLAQINQAIRQWKSQGGKVMPSAGGEEMPEDNAENIDSEDGETGDEAGRNTGSLNPDLDYGELYGKLGEDKEDDSAAADLSYAGSTAGGGSGPGDAELAEMLPGFTPEYIHNLRQIPWVNPIEDFYTQSDDDAPREFPFPDLHGKTPLEAAIEDEKQKTIYETLLKLEERERMVLCCRFGLMGYPEQTLQELSVRLNCSAERVRQIQNKAAKHLKAIIEKL